MLRIYFLNLTLMLWMSSIVNSQDISLMYLNGYMPGTLLNPAMPLHKKLNVSLGATSFSAGTNGPAINNLTSKNQDGERYINLNTDSGDLNDVNDAFVQFDIRTVDVGVKVGSFVLMAGHGFRSNGNLRYSSDLIHVLSEGNANFIGKTLDIGPTIDFMAYNELYLGAQKTSGKFTIGLKAKLLYGTSSISTISSDIKFTTLPEIYQLQFMNDYELRSSSLIRYNSLDSITANYSNFTFDNMFYNNRGLGLDLGVTFQANENITFSASALDIGSIKWDFFPRKYSTKGTFTFEGVDLVEYLVDSTLSIQDTLLDLIKVKSEIAEFSTPLNSTFALGGSYNKDNWSFNVLYQLKNRFGFRNHSLSLSAVRKISIFDLGIQYTIAKNDYSGLGILARIRLGAFAAYVASDNIVGMISPLDAKSASMRIGATLQF